MIRQLKTKVRSLLGLRNETDYYAQGGEDAIVSKIFSYVLPVEKGFYVDVGAYHPFKHSNTYLLYKAGWRGVNIDPRPGSKALFDKHRPRDINLEYGVASQDGSLTYYMIGEESTMNTFSRENLERLGMMDAVTETVEVPVRKLSAILADHASGSDVDYLNIDAEGYELEILGELASSSIRPAVISVEQNGPLNLRDVLQSETCAFLSQNNYTPIAKNIIIRDISTVFYIREDDLHRNI
jgi:FkbM family methyltransferase